MAREMKDSGIEWIGEIPATWKLSNVKNNFTRKKSKALLSDPVVLSLARSGVKVRDLSNNEGQIAESYYEYNPVAIGDLLLNPMDLYSGANCSISKVEGVISPAYINLKSKEGVNPVFFDYYFKHQYWCMAFFAHGEGVSFDNRWTLNNETLMNYPIVLPSEKEQNDIASFLDSKCAEIDKAIDATKASIEEYRKLRQAIITEAVTKGMDPDVEMKDSGIEWIGEIPKHWDVTKIGKSFSLRDEKNFKSEDETQLLSLYTGRGVFPTGDEGTINSGNHAQTVIGYKVVKKDDIVVNIILAWMGAIGISEYDGVVSPAYDVYIPNKNIVCPRFCHYLFRTTGIANECYKYGRGIMMMRWRTYSPEFKQIRIPLPPIREQMKIASYLDTKCSEIDSLIKSKEKLIEELTSYRKSLIYEYVTGKKEVL